MKNEIQDFFWPQYACDICAREFAHIHTPTPMHIYMYIHIGTQKHMYSKFSHEGEAWERILLNFLDMFRRFLGKGRYAMSTGEIKICISF